jgi:hypothetical protein
MVAINKTSDLYELDYYAWTQQQTQFLQAGKWDCLDIPNLIEEIESLGKQERRELRNRLGILLGHLLKWEFQPHHRSRSWFATIREQRFQVQQLLKESPSLQPYLTEALETAYQSGLNLAVDETSLSYKVFPQECPYSPEQTLDSDFFPGRKFELEDYS